MFIFYDSLIHLLNAQAFLFDAMWHRPCCNLTLTNFSFILFITLSHSLCSAEQKKNSREAVTSTSNDPLHLFTSLLTNELRFFLLSFIIGCYYYLGLIIVKGRLLLPPKLIRVGLPAADLQQGSQNHP
jgi:hypothetical protein